MAGRARAVVRLAVLQQLRAAYGIKVKSGSCRGAAGKQPGAAAVEGKVFGISLHSLPQSVVPEYGSIPSFLVDACKYLEEHVHTEGLFRKSGSFVRLKTLKSQLDQGENCLPAALPCDVAGLLKQFFRELPEPILPTDLQEALFKAQHLEKEEKNTATVLLSCLVADRTIDTLRYFFNFLRNVSLRSNENKMDSRNLAVIFAPNLLHSSDNEKMSVNTEKKLRLQAAVVQTLIDHAADIGRVPEFILEKIPAMLGIDALDSTPSLKGYEESESPSQCKRRRRRSVGDIVSGALNKLKSNRTPSTTPQRDRNVTPLILTPSTKRKLPTDSSQGFSSKKRRSLKHNFAFELLSSSLFSSASTPASAQFEASPHVSLESSQSSLSPSVSSEKHLSSTGNRRSKRIASKKIYRVESGKTGCFSPKISRKEMVRRSLRLKFSLGKSSKDVNVLTGCPVGKGSENIGRRLASQQDLENTVESVKTDILFSTRVSEKFSKKGSQIMSKSEENLLTPKCDKANYRMSWNGPSITDSHGTSNNEASLMGYLETESCFSEPVLIVEKPPAIPDDLRSTTANHKQDNSLREYSLCVDENNLTTETLLKIKKAFSESGSNLQNLIGDAKSSVSDLREEKLTETPCLSGVSPEKDLVETSAESLAAEKSKDQFNQFANKSNTTDKYQSSKDEIKVVEENSFQNPIVIELQRQKLGMEDAPEFSMPQVMSREDRLTFQNSYSKDNLKKIDSFRRKEGEELEQSERVAEDYELKSRNSAQPVAAGELPVSPLLKSRNRPGKLYLQTGGYDNTVPKTLPVSDYGKVSDHVHWFNKLSLNDPCSASKTKPPLKFQRTPVRQSVRRINSLLDSNRQSVSYKLAKPGDVCSPLVKSVSYDTALSSCTEKFSKNSTVSLLYCETTHTQVSTSSELDLASKSSKSINLLEQADVSVKTVRICKQKVTIGNPSKSVLEDLTNHEAPKAAVKINSSINIPIATPDKSTLRKSATGKEKARYRGSPKNPISKAKLLPTTKPVDL
ncbi:rho GTPase-activating protein 11A-like isoform X1 [Malaclemys terrapin pileata]|uniref:rho GTPase-activating protein 11A-like isoform X1 n=1 Tax=Malaclemys terrapin pileata TaxID=2991368 RepID=UPI0023A846CF|nr:rho GTPase-activating protein 11A-like isoform X1 [Malaclemys terrapin pileata]